MPSSQATVTAKIGAGQQATAVLLSDITDIHFNCDGNNLSITLRNGQVKYFAGYTTITLTVSSGSYTLTVT